jgi:uncharacterized damage-inducible protein DinB
MDSRLTPLAEILRLNTRLFRNCLDGMSEEQARMRPSPAANSAAFVAAHVAESRYFILKCIGAERPSPLEPFVGGWKAIDAITAWPTLDQIRAAWTAAGTALDQRFASITPAELDAPSDMGFPVESKTTAGVLAFLVQHDSHHVGQLAWLRKYAGLPAMKYD